MKVDMFLVIIVAMVFLVGIVGVVSTTTHTKTLAGDAYRFKAVKGTASPFPVKTTSSQTYSKHSIRTSPSKQMRVDGDEGKTACVEAVNEGLNYYAVPGVSITFVPGDENNRMTTRRYADFCKKIDGKMNLIEYSCNGDSVRKEVIPCDCYGGMCDYIPPTNATTNTTNTTTTTTINCTDTDNGINAFVYGITTSNTFPLGMADYCGAGYVNGSFTGLISTSCTAEEMNATGYTCGVLDHECVANDSVEEFVVCNECANGVCLN